MPGCEIVDSDFKSKNNRKPLLSKAMFNNAKGQAAHTKCQALLSRKNKSNKKI